MGVGGHNGGGRRRAACLRNWRTGSAAAKRRPGHGSFPTRGHIRAAERRASLPVTVFHKRRTRALCNARVRQRARQEAPVAAGFSRLKIPEAFNLLGRERSGDVGEEGAARPRGRREVVEPIVTRLRALLHDRLGDVAELLHADLIM